MRDGLRTSTTHAKQKNSKPQDFLAGRPTESLISPWTARQEVASK